MAGGAEDLGQRAPRGLVMCRGPAASVWIPPAAWSLALSSRLLPWELQPLSRAPSAPAQGLGHVICADAGWSWSGSPSLHLLWLCHDNVLPERLSSKPHSGKTAGRAVQAEETLLKIWVVGPCAGRGPDWSSQCGTAALYVWARVGAGASVPVVKGGDCRRSV